MQRTMLANVARAALGIGSAQGGQIAARTPVPESRNLTILGSGRIGAGQV